MDNFSKIKELISQLPVIGEYPWLLIVIAGVLIIGGFFILKPRRRKPAVADEPEELIEAEEVEVIDKEPQVIDAKSIAEFFVRLYKVQLGASKNALYKISELESETIQPRKTYELKVIHNKEWVSRRMTVGPAGSESASRSKCFYVIYDNHLVVKVPQKPIKDFDAYISAIAADQEIVRKLAPRECIVPTVSAVLKLIHPISLGKDLTPTQIEDKYLEWLRKFDSFQEFLKIGESFVLVMDLSKYFFMSNIIDDIHDLNNKMYQEVVGYPDVVWENHGFEGRYAFENDAEVEAVRNVYSQAEEELGLLLKKAGLEKGAARYSMQKWFLVHLAGMELESDEKDVNPDLVVMINALLKKVFEENKDIIENYKKTIRGCIQTVTIAQNKHQIGGMVTNILDLLAWLHKQGVAIRDLKPDNLLVAGDQANYPEFLNSTKDYKVGLIDVETAVVYGSVAGDVIQQPLLGGTPSYATPSHLVLNDALKGLYGDLPRTLYLQDWYAVVAMIYEVITGESLFSQTGKMVVGIKTAIFKHIDDLETQQELFKKASGMFWHSANTEFSNKMHDKKEILKSVQVVIPDSAKDMITQEVSKEKKITTSRIERYVAEQNVFKGEKSCYGLIRASRLKITQLKSKLEAQGKEKTAGFKVLQNLEQIKLGTEKQLQLIKLFVKPNLILPAYVLLDHLFNIIQHAMHREEWGELLAAKVVGVKDSTDTTTLESTV